MAEDETKLLMANSRGCTAVKSGWNTGASTDGDRCFTVYSMHRCCTMGWCVPVQLHDICVMLMLLLAISVVLTMKFLPVCIQCAKVTPTVS